MLHSLSPTTIFKIQVLLLVPGLQKFMVCLSLLKIYRLVLLQVLPNKMKKYHMLGKGEKISYIDMYNLRLVKHMLLSFGYIVFPFPFSQDCSDNVTRFLMLAREPVIPGVDKPFKASNIIP